MVAGCAPQFYQLNAMKKTFPRLKPLSPAALARFEEIEYEFHVRAFGEEMARVNFLPLNERKKYVAEMFDHAVSKGVKFEKPALGVTP